ncbi:MAG: prefoldin subunit alpha [Candidatus Micrarchaeia archaeon]
MNEKEQKEYLQDLAIEADIHQRRAQDIQNQMQALQMAETEMERTVEALKNLKERNNTLFSLGSGIFVNAELKGIDKLLVNVGSNVMVEMSIEEALEFIDERKKEVNAAKEDLLKGMQAISHRLKEIDTEARKIISRSQPGAGATGGTGGVKDV